MCLCVISTVVSVKKEKGNTAEHIQACDVGPIKTG